MTKEMPESLSSDPRSIKVCQREDECKESLFQSGGKAKMVDKGCRHHKP